MDFVRTELEFVKNKIRTVRDTELISCVPVMVQVKIKKTVHKQLTLCMQFPEGYPDQALIVELKSKHLSAKLLDGLTKVCETEAKKILGQQQVIYMVKFVVRFIEENPLCVCSDEIAVIKKELLAEQDEIRLKQKTSQVVLRLRQEMYHMTVKVTVPDNYPIAALGIEVTEQNFPELLKINTVTQAVEIGRQCIEPPLKKKPKDPPFVAQSALRPVCQYLIKEIIRPYPTEKCPCCGELSLPSDPKNVINDPSNAQYVDRMYCKHLFHHGCLEAYLKLPPFTGGKKCPTCRNRIYHDRFKLSPELAEARWAHKEARDRELSEVVDFLE